MGYKRNQVEEAIAKVYPPEARSSFPLTNGLKRLLDTDRRLGRKRSSNAEISTYAFFPQEPPGQGFDVEFGEYDAFALLVGVQMLYHGFPQQDVVKTLRRVRASLKKEHSRILSLNSKDLFDQEELRRSVRSGQPAYKTTKPSFLVVRTHRGHPHETADVHLCKD